MGMWPFQGLKWLEFPMSLRAVWLPVHGTWLFDVYEIMFSLCGALRMERVHGVLMCERS